MSLPLRIIDWSLRVKMAALLVVVSVLPLGVAAFVDIRGARERVRESTAALLAARADQLVGELDTFHRGYQRSVDRVAHLPSVMQFCQAGPEETRHLAQSVRTVLEVWPASDRSIRGLAILDLSGAVKLATEDPLIGVNLSRLGYVREALKGAAVTSDIHLAAPQVGSPPTIAYLAPVRGPHGGTVGAAVFWVRAAALWDVAKASNELAGPRSFAVLFDHQGIRIAHTYSDEIVFHPGGPLDPAVVDALVAEHRFGEKTRELLEDVRAFPEQFDRARSDSPSTGLFRGFAPVNQQWNYGVARRFETVPWTIFYMIPEGPLEAEIAAMTLRKGVFAAAIALVALLAGALFALVILRPIRSLSEATESLAGGDLAARVREGHADEIGRLGASFNSMADRIEAQATALQRAHDDLERRVEQRTAELAQTTKTLEAEVAQRARAEKDLLRSEERYRHFFEDDLAGAFITRAEGAFIDCNRAFLRMFGFASVAEAKETGAAALYPNPELRESILDRLRREGSLEGLELELRRRDGAPIHVLANLVGTLDAEGALVEIKGYVFDQTERKKVEEQLRQSQRIDAIGRLAAGVAHDFNNLLGVITGNGELLRKRLPADEVLIRYVEQILASANRAASLTRQLLAFSRKQILQPKVLDLNVVVLEMERLLGRLIGEDVDLVTVAQPDLDKVRVDPGQMEQVLMNMAVNARDAMPEGGKLTIETANVVLDADYVRQHAGSRAGRHVMLAVSDTGQGMDAETQTRIFEPFFTTKSAGKGTGLGLSTVYGIVKQSEGSIWVYSEPGRGTIFKVYLPSTADAGAAEAEPAEPPASGGSETVLVVEDEETLREIVREALQADGYTVLEARHGAEALRIGDEHEGPIHLVVTDTVMPGVGGRELAERFRSLRPETRVLFMSGYTDDTIVRHGILTAKVAFLQKPFSLETLARKVREVLDAPNETAT